MEKRAKKRKHDSVYLLQQVRSLTPVSTQRRYLLKQTHEFLLTINWFTIQNSRVRIQDSRFKIQDSRFKIQDSRLKIQD